MIVRVMLVLVLTGLALAWLSGHGVRVPAVVDRLLKQSRSAGVRVLLALLLVGVVLAGVSITTAKDPPPADETAAAEVKDLKQQRLKTLQRVSELSQLMYDEGSESVTFVDLQEKRLAVIDASLDLAGNREERVDLLRQAVKQRERGHALLERLWRSGEATEVSVLESEAALLQAKIALVTEQTR